MGTRIDEGVDGPQTVDEAREAVERSRQRISSTLDRLEERIVEKKHEIRDRVDVLRPVREQIAQRPFTAVAAGVVVGVLLGSLGGDDDDGDHRRRSGRVSGRTLSDDDREELNEWRRARRRRLRAALRRQEAERGGARRGRGREREESDSRFDALKHQLLGALTSAVTSALTARVRRMATENVGSLMDSVMGDDEERGRRPVEQGRGRSGRGDDRMGRRTRYPERETYP